MSRRFHYYLRLDCANARPIFRGRDKWTSDYGEAEFYEDKRTAMRLWVEFTGKVGRHYRARTISLMRTRDLPPPRETLENGTEIVIARADVQLVDRIGGL